METRVFQADQARENISGRGKNLHEGKEAGTDMTCQETTAAQYEKWATSFEKEPWALLLDRTHVPASVPPKTYSDD